jgi:hypothetical protein
MVRGEWIVNLKDMRCKNWVNGIEIKFFLNEENVPEGRIRYCPQELIENLPGSIDFIMYLYKMWRNATCVFKKAYYKKINRHITPSAVSRSAKPLRRRQAL